jgi:hypothetical protein
MTDDHDGAVPEVETVTSAPESIGDDLEPVPYAALASREVPLVASVPMSAPAGLPLRELDPESFERLVAELVSRRNHRGVQFYGRRGQKQYGLDVVELEPDDRRSLYQVKRYQTLTPEDIEAAVIDYAGSPHPPEARIFDPYRFVLVTSAELDSDTGNVNKVHELRKRYKDDLEIEVWGAETINRLLRDLPRVVYAIFGPAWAKAYCGYDPSPTLEKTPKSLGLVEDPTLALNLASLLSEAEAIETTEPGVSASLYRTVADALASGGFPGHANIIRRSEARAAEAADDRVRAFDVLWDLAREQVKGDEDLRADLQQELMRLGEAIPERHGRAVALRELGKWAESGIELSPCVEALEQLVEAGDREAAWLCCGTLESVLAEGLLEYQGLDFGVVVPTDAETDGLLARLIELTSQVHSTDRVLSARIQAALADAKLNATSSPADVEAVFGPLASDAMAGRYLDGGALLCARAARRFAIHGDPQRARTLYRQSILAAGESGFFGDVRGALRALFILDAEVGEWRFAHHKELVDALPNRRMAAQSRQDHMYGVLESAHDNKLPDAKSDARLAIRQNLVGGHLLDEQHAHRLFGDVLAAAQYPVAAVHQYVIAGQGKRAMEVAAGLPEPAGVEACLDAGLRARRAAAIQVVQVQARLLADKDVEQLVGQLLDVADSYWAAPHAAPFPEMEALKALSSIGIRIPEVALDRILDLAEPCMAAPKRGEEELVRLLVNAYHALPSRRTDLAPKLAELLGRADPPHNVWALVRGLDEPGDLHDTVVALAASGHGEAILTLAEWRATEPVVQQAARSACASLLRRPEGETAVSTTSAATVDLLLALLDEGTALVSFPASAFTPDRCWTPGGLVMSVGIVREDAEPSATPVPSLGDVVDGAAECAAGAPSALAAAVAQKLVEMIEDQTSYGAARARAGGSLFRLIPALAPVDCSGLPERLLAVALDPNHSDLDQFELSTDLLSRFQFNMGVSDLPFVALVCAGAALRRVSLERELTDDEVAVGRAVFAACARHLATGESRELAAAAIESVAACDPSLRSGAYALIAHPDPGVRALGARVVELDGALQTSLASDASPQVRMALASRADELDAEVVKGLGNDADLGVRRVLLRSLIGPGPQ